MGYAAAFAVVKWGLSLSGMGSSGGGLDGEILQQILDVRSAIENSNNSISDLRVELAALQSEIIQQIYSESARNRGDEVYASISSILSSIERIKNNRFLHSNGDIDDAEHQSRRASELEKLIVYLERLERDRRVVGASFIGKEDLESIFQAWPIEKRVREYLELSGFTGFFTRKIQDQMRSDYKGMLEKGFQGTEKGSIGWQISEAISSQNASLQMVIQHSLSQKLQHCSYFPQRLSDRYGEDRAWPWTIKEAYWIQTHVTAITKSEYVSVQDSRSLVGQYKHIVIKTSIPEANPAFTLLETSHARMTSSELRFKGGKGKYAQGMKKCERIELASNNKNGWVDGWNGDHTHEVENFFPKYSTAKKQIFEELFNKSAWVKQKKSDEIELRKRVEIFNLWTIRREIFELARVRSQELINKIAES